MKALPMDRFLGAAGGIEPIRIELAGPGDGPKRQFEFHQAFVLVGSLPRCDLWLDSREVSGRQLYLQLVNGRLFAVHLSERVRTYWRTTPQTSGWIRTGDWLTFGPFTLRFPGVAVEPASTLPENPMAVGSFAGPPVILELATGSSTPAQARISRVMTFVGNDPICKLRINSSRASSVHCCLVRTTSGLWAVDLASREGTQVNGITTKVALLADGDILEIGRRQLAVRYQEQPLPEAARQADDASDDGTSFSPTEVALFRAALLPAMEPGAPGNDAAMALFQMMDRFDKFQSESMEQNRTIIATLVRAFESVLQEHRLVRDELQRLDEITRELAELSQPASQLKAGSPPQTAAVPPVDRTSAEEAPASNDLPTPRVDPVVAEQFQSWIQKRLIESGDKRSSLWERMAAILRSKDPGGS